MANDSLHDPGTQYSCVNVCTYVCTYTIRCPFDRCTPWHMHTHNAWSMYKRTVHGVHRTLQHSHVHTQHHSKTRQSIYSTLYLFLQCCHLFPQPFVFCCHSISSICHCRTYAKHLNWDLVLSTTLIEAINGSNGTCTYGKVHRIMSQNTTGSLVDRTPVSLVSGTTYLTRPSKDPTCPLLLVDTLNSMAGRK